MRKEPLSAEELARRIARDVSMDCLDFAIKLIEEDRALYASADKMTAIVEKQG